MQPAFTVRGSWGRTVAAAIHAGHDLRQELDELVAVDASTRLREEDPFTDRLTATADIAVIAHRSRFEIDLNRARAQAVYEAPEDAWGLDCWKRELPDAVVERSLQIYDAFYDAMARIMDPLAERGAFLVLDIHSYNHRRDGARAPAAPASTNPEVNVGTGSLDSRRWGHVVDGFITELSRSEVSGHRLDVRENVRFRGGHFSRWVNERYPGTGCALALEFKKLFMDEWTGAVDQAHLAQLVAALRVTVPAVVVEMDREIA